MRPDAFGSGDSEYGDVCADGEREACGECPVDCDCGDATKFSVPNSALCVAMCAAERAAVSDERGVLMPAVGSDLGDSAADAADAADAESAGIEAGVRDEASCGGTVGDDALAACASGEKPLTERADILSADESDDDDDDDAVTDADADDNAEASERATDDAL